MLHVQTRPKKRAYFGYNEIILLISPIVFYYLSCTLRGSEHGAGTPILPWIKLELNNAFLLTHFVNYTRPEVNQPMQKSIIYKKYLLGLFRIPEPCETI